MYDFYNRWRYSWFNNSEIFSRSGYKVILMEKIQRSVESSGYHEWFHFGSLYSIFQIYFLRILVEDIDLLLYYRNFKNIILKLTIEKN